MTPAGCCSRVTALRILCELRLEKDDLHNVVEHAIHPPRKTKAEKKAAALAAAQGRRRNAPPEPPPPTMEQMRKQPLAKDSSGLMYWYLDYHTTTGSHSCITAVQIANLFWQVGTLFGRCMLDGKFSSAAG